MFFWLFAIGYCIICLGVTSAAIRARTGQECILLRASIYCYGGAMSHPAGATTPESVLTEDIFIRLNVPRSSNLIALQDKWDVLDGPAMEPNYYFAMAALPTLNSFIIDGGRGFMTKINGTVSGGHITQQITSLYNASGDGSWTFVNTTRQNHTNSHVALIGKNNTVYIYGGRRTDQRMDEPEFPQQMITFNNQSNPQWHYQSDFLKPYSPQIRIHHKGSFGLDQQTIYYIGGLYKKKSAVLPQTCWEEVDMSDILIYDTRNGTWDSVRAHGMNPTPRVEHTITLNPITGDLVIYGGASQGSRDPLEDFMYTFNTETLEFKNVTPMNSINAPGAGPRFGHSAVLVDNNSLLILFGSAYYLDTSAYTLQNEFHVLDISNGYVWKSKRRLHSYLKKRDKPDNWQVIIGATFGSLIPGVIAIFCFYVLYIYLKALYTSRRAKRAEPPQRFDDAASPPSPPPPPSSSSQLPPQSSQLPDADSSNDGSSGENNAQEKPVIVRLTRPDTP